MLKITGLDFRYSKKSPYVLKDFSLELGDGSIGILLGKNGLGKTTVFRNIVGVCRPRAGTITVDGEDISDMSVRERAKRVAYVEQEVKTGGMSVFDTVLLGRLPYFGVRPGRADEEAVMNVLDELGISDLASRDPQKLSGGERRKVAIARALVQEPKVLVLDEPTGNLDITGEQLIAKEAKRAAKERGITVLMSLHDLNLSAAIGDRFFMMKDGKVNVSGGQEVLTKENIDETYDADVEIGFFNNKKIILLTGRD